MLYSVLFYVLRVGVMVVVDGCSLVVDVVFGGVAVVVVVVVVAARCGLYGCVCFRGGDGCCSGGGFSGGGDAC